ncbi:MAG: DUF2294 domain-containing protein [Cyanobacteria bacterium J06650_10]
MKMGSKVSPQLSSQLSADATVKKSQQTVGQLERTISQKMQALYKKQLGHQPSKVTCQMFDSKLAIVLENSITQPEKLLVEEGKADLATKVHSNLNQAIEPQIKSLIENILSVKVLDLLSDAAIDTARTGIIVVLSDTPTVRNPEAIPKVKK